MNLKTLKDKLWQSADMLCAGAFYTPDSVVRYMVEVLQSTVGDKQFLDPTCGSGGMFVQASRYMHRHNKPEGEPSGNAQTPLIIMQHLNLQSFYLGTILVNFAL